MSKTTDKKMRQEIRRAGSDIYDEIKRQVNALPYRQRRIIAKKIKRGMW